MNLLENDEAVRRSKNSKRLMIIISVLIVLLIVVCVVILYMMSEIQKNTMKFSVDGKSATYDESMFSIEGDKVYVAIKKFGELMGYTAYNGDYKDSKYTETTTDCYLSSTDEVASFSLNSNTIYKKVPTNEDYEYFELSEPVKLIDGELFVIEEGIEIGTNCLIQYNAANNQISVVSLDYLSDYYATEFPNSAVANDNVDFNNKKALRYDLVVVRDANNYYGVYSADNREIIGAKYTSIQFKEDSQEFTVRTEEGRMGILSNDGTTKIEPNYTEIKQISRDLNYYLVSDGNKYGVINHNGNIVIHLEYDQIGVNADNFNSNGLENPYVLYEKCIPVYQNKKWGLYNINGQLILPIEYDSMGCLVGRNAAASASNVLTISQYEAIVVGKEDKYAIVDTTGKEYVPMILNAVYFQVINGQDKYSMTFNMPQEQDGEIVEVEHTYDVDQYFEEQILDEPATPELNTNTVDGNTVVDANVIADANTITSNTVDTNTVSTNTPAQNEVVTNTTTTE